MYLNYLYVMLQNEDLYEKFIEYLEKNNIADPKIISVYSKILNIYGDYIKAMYK